MEKTDTIIFLKKKKTLKDYQKNYLEVKKSQYNNIINKNSFFNYNLIMYAMI